MEYLTYIRLATIILPKPARAEHPTVLHFECKLIALLTNIRLALKNFVMEKTSSVIFPV